MQIIEDWLKKADYPALNHAAKITSLNDNLALTYLVEAAHQKHVLKVYPLERLMAFLNLNESEVHDLLEWQLSLTDFPNPILKRPAIIRDQQGRFFSYDQNHFFYVEEFIEGASPALKQFSPAQISQVGKLLGALHGLNPTFYPPKFWELKHKIFLNYIANILRIYNRDLVLNAAEQLQIEKSTVDYIDQIVQYIKKIDFKDMIKEPGQVFCHFDLKPKNLIWQESTPYLIDWETCGLMKRNYDFLNTFIAFSYDEIETGYVFNPLFAEKFMQGYQKAHSTPLTLTEGDLHLANFQVIIWLIVNLAKPNVPEVVSSFHYLAALQKDHDKLLHFPSNFP